MTAFPVLIFLTLSNVLAPTLATKDVSCSKCFTVKCAGADRETCEAKNGIFLPRDTSQEICRCCSICLDQGDYCDRCASVDCARDIRYDTCKSSGSYFSSPYPSKDICRCCSECKCCGQCDVVKCANVDPVRCQQLGGVLKKADRTCKGTCNCCDQCLIPVEKGGQCSVDDLPVGFSKVCSSSGLQCWGGVCP